MVDLRTVRKRAGLTQRELARLTGVGHPNIAAMETGNRTMGYAVAEELAGFLEVDSAQLLVANRLAAMDRAAKTQDAPSVIRAVKTIVEITGEKDIGGDLQRELEDFIASAVRLAQSSTASS